MLKGRGKREKRNGGGEFLVAVFPRLRYGGGLNDGGTAMSHAQHAHSWPRRRFMSVCGTAVCSLAARRARADAGGEELACFGIVADCHYAERDDKQGVRAYRESVNKLAECVAQMNLQGVGALIELGDFKDAGGTAEQTAAFLRTIEGVFSRFKGARYHVLGNHDMDRISKAQFLAAIENSGFAQARAHYAFDLGGLRAVVLDANYRADGVPYEAGNFDWRQAHVPEAELAWLRGELAVTRRPVVAFVHQRLDADEGDVYVRNAAAVRRVLEQSGRVRAVFQGHHHEGGYRAVNGIHYVTLNALVVGKGEANNAYAVVRAMRDGRLVITGFRTAPSRVLTGAPFF